MTLGYNVEMANLFDIRENGSDQEIVELNVYTNIQGEIVLDMDMSDGQESEADPPKVFVTMSPKEAVALRSSLKDMLQEVVSDISADTPD